MIQRMTERLIPSLYNYFMDPSASKPFNLDIYTSLQPHLLDELRQRVFRVSGWLFACYSHCAPRSTLHHQIVLAMVDPLRGPRYTHRLGWSGMAHLSCTDGLICFLIVVFPSCASRVLLFTLSSYPIPPHSLRSWIGSICWKLVQVAMDIERFSHQGRKWIPCLRISVYVPAYLAVYETMYITLVLVIEAIFHTFFRDLSTREHADLVPALSLHSPRQS